MNKCTLRLTKPTFREKAARIGLWKTLGFSGPVFLDSGGFRLMRDENTCYGVRDILAVQQDLRPCLAAILDIPPAPSHSTAQRRSRWAATMRNTELMYASNREVQLVPVLHGYSSQAIRIRASRIQNTVGDSAFICIGGLVPLFRQPSIASSFTPSNPRLLVSHQGWQVLVRLLLAAQHAYPDSVIHVLGAGVP